MKIIEYDPKYEEDAKDLLVELEEYIVSIDKDELDQVGERYREEYLGILLDNMAMKQGKVYLAIESDKAIGLVAGSIKEWEYADHLDYKCPKTGIVEDNILQKKDVNMQILTFLHIIIMLLIFMIEMITMQECIH